MKLSKYKIAALASLVVLVTGGCSNPSSTEMVGQWKMDCSGDASMSVQQVENSDNVNTIELTVDADSFFFRSMRGTTSLSNWRYGYKVLEINGSNYALEAAIKGKIVSNIHVDVVDENHLKFGENWFDAQLIPPHFKACSFVRLGS